MPRERAIQMRLVSAFPMCLRFKKPLLIGLVLVITVALLHNRGSLQTPFRPAALKIDVHGDRPVPAVSEWLASASAWTTDTKSDIAFNVKEAFEIRQSLGKSLGVLFREYAPPISEVSADFLERWPTMPPYQVNKTYDYKEVVGASENFFRHHKTQAAFKIQQQALLKAIPSWESVSKGYSGRGVVISAGGDSIRRVWPTVVLMLRALNSRLPIEIWTKDRYEYSRTMPIVHQMRTELNLAVSVHTLSDYMDISWEGPLPVVFKVKALALLFSTFEEIILLDVDSVPVMDPNVLFETEEAESGLIQWPDFWSNSNSEVLLDAYDIDPTMNRTCESGQMLISKKKQFEPLVLATYHNWFGPDFFYKLIYLDSMGAGDKDTFYFGSAAYHQKYHVVSRDVELIRAKRMDGTLWKNESGIFNGAMAQFNPRNLNEIFFMHLHSPKINMQADELKGQYDLLFFHPEVGQKVSFAHGQHWLETRLWESLQWIECESVLRDLTTNACDGISMKLGGLMSMGY